MYCKINNGDCRRSLEPVSRVFFYLFVGVATRHCANLRINNDFRNVTQREVLSLYTFRLFAAVTQLELCVCVCVWAVHRMGFLVFFFLLCWLLTYTFFPCSIFYLQRYLHGRPQAEVEMLVSSKTFGATPLVVAARNGHYDTVYYLLNKTHADCEQSGSGKRHILWANDNAFALSLKYIQSIN